MSKIACLVVIALVLLQESALAEASIDIAGGFNHFLITANNGDYIQNNLPRSLDRDSAAYKIGACWSFNERWTGCGDYVNFGTLKQSAVFVGDENYNHKTGQCLNGCPGQAHYKITDAYHGGELTLTRKFALNDDWAVNLKGGAAYLMHRFTINKLGSGAFLEHYGQFIATVAGVGASYKWAYVELDYYHGLGGSNGFLGYDQGWPLSKEIVTTWFGFHIPIGGML